MWGCCLDCAGTGFITGGWDWSLFTLDGLGGIVLCAERGYQGCWPDYRIKKALVWGSCIRSVFRL